MTQTYKFLLFFEEEWGKQKEHLILWWAICLGTGVALYFSLSFEPSFIVCSLCALVCGLLCLLLRYTARFISFLFLGLALIGLGFTAGAYRTLSVEAPRLQKEIKFADVTGTVVKVEEREKGVQRVFLKDVLIAEVGVDDTPYMIQISVRQKVEYHVGDRIAVLVSLRPPSPPVIPRGFDFQRFFYFKGIGATGFAMSHPEILKQQAQVHNSKLDERLFQLREAMKERVHNIPSIANPISQALLTGERGLVDEYTWDHLRDSGLSHMLAISGLHVGLFSATVFFIMRLILSLFPAFSLRFSNKKVAAVLGFGAALFYTILVGASVPTVRACVMTGMFFLAIIMDRSPFSVHLLAFAAFLVLLIRPESLMSASFQMSFAAVMGLIVFYSETRGWWVKQYSNASFFRRSFMYFISVIATTIVATIVTMPFTLYHFQHVAVLGILANIMAVPVMAFVVMPMAVFAYFLMPFSLEYFPLMVMRLGVEKIIQISEWVGGLGWASLSLPTMPFVSFCLFTIAGLWFLTVRGYLKSACVPSFLVALFLMVLARPADIYLTDDGKVWGVHNDDKLYVSNIRKDKFAQKQWHASLGVHHGHSYPTPRSGCDGLVCCDEGACRIEMNGQRVSVLREKYVIQEECKQSDLLIAPFSVSKKLCRNIPSIDWYDFKENGAYMLWLAPDGRIGTRSAQEGRGERPWVSSTSTF